MMSEKVKIGVYVCHCGFNIAEMVDVKKLLKCWEKKKMWKLQKILFLCVLTLGKR